MYHYFRIIPRKQLGTFVIRVLNWRSRNTREKAKRIATKNLGTNDFEIKFITQDIFLDGLFKDDIVEITQELKEQQ